MNSHHPLPILVLDDDEIIRVAIQETLKIEGYNVIPVDTAEKAFENLKSQPFSVIISDQQMPVMTGLEFLAKAKEIQPNAARILITGVLTLKTIIDAVNKGEIFRFLAKPWVREELLATIKNAVQRNELLTQNQRLQEETSRLNEELARANAELKKQVVDLADNNKELDEAHEVLHKNFQQSVELCFRILSTFHPILGKQTKTIVDICKLLSDSDYLDDDEKRVLQISSWLHNIGLIGIRRDVVNRSVQHPSSLEPHELALIKNHPIYGQTFAGFVDKFESVGITIRAHHERWDGSGYPDGLAAENIPKPARLLAVAVFYVESGLSRQDAVDEILRLSDKAFEPEAARLFLKVTHLVKLPPKVKEILLSELTPGMVLAQGIHTPNGVLLLPENHMLDLVTLRKLREHNLVEPIPERILTYY
ncbi:MAG: two-component system response regulator [Verrucomicrobia bacterium CG_4_10_14_3_um_filter_43_23]|nr:MAG: two-component system response regulator [Verrucomicrobia bacterium CG1_02_43_26]PIP60027.1 MAG: two-component system response regulator [Verrucomicrobia bacterium CG22_combo_CG10-13_8_21_14_all_43_17]PIX58311.1 MAG: two-component system response regulator [Verrucomicrobia bacterium CG_4_10_14_3_um_filter_43_23]PIY62326.1 MAG: two-component system response regulator [Verrucomicrobia bacterium CG_4_10_14_0_8_um_filter_43_34]PJA43773.1 MAG: two-component system response regulator [Verrucom